MAQRGEIPAPGARVIIRDAQWLVRKVERTQGDGYTLFCTGLSEIVRDKEARFLTRAEKKIEILDPAQTRLVAEQLFVDGKKQSEITGAEGKLLTRRTVVREKENALIGMADTIGRYRKG